MAYKLIGQNFVPHDVVAKVTGRAKYAEYFRGDGMVFCKLLTSPMPHAKIRNIDASEALKMPGVLGILTADDVPQFPPPQRPILQKDEVFFIGDPILALAAVDETSYHHELEMTIQHQEQSPHHTQAGRRYVVIQKQANAQVLQRVDLRCTRCSIQGLPARNRGQLR